MNACELVEGGFFESVALRCCMANFLGHDLQRSLSYYKINVLRCQALSHNECVYMYMYVMRAHGP